ncbi:unnamed protein product [Ectocarpus sp. 8 AP-2014]
MSATAAAGFTATQRMHMFYMICVPIRLSLSALVYQFGSHPLVRSVAIISGLASYFFNSKKLRDARPNDVWWYRPVHMLSGVSVSILFIISSKPMLPSAILVADTLIGLATSFYQKPFV